MQRTITTASPELSHRQVLWLLVGVGAAMLFSQLDHTIVSVALPTIVGSLGGLEHLAWVITAFTLASTASMPIWGKFGDLFQRRRTFQAAVVLFLLGSVLCGLSQSMLHLIICRAIQGLGAGGIMVVALAIVADAVSPRERGRYVGALMAVGLLAWLAGPVVGGFFVEGPGWRWVFYVNVPVGALVLCVTNLVFPRTRAPKRTGAINYAGMALITSGVTALLLVTSWGGSIYAWSSPLIVALFATGGALMAVFVVNQHRAEEPVMPLRLFTTAVSGVSNLYAVVTGPVLLAAGLFLPVYIQTVLAIRPRLSGLPMFPVLLGHALAGIVAGRLVSRWGRYKVFPIVGSMLMVAGFVLLGTMSAGSTWIALSAYTTLLAIGVGLGAPALTVAIQNAVDRKDLGCRGFHPYVCTQPGRRVWRLTVRSRVCQSVGVKPQTLGTDRFRQEHKPQGDTGGDSRLPETVRAGVVESFAASIHFVWRASIPFAFASLVVALFLRELPLASSDEASVEEDQASTGALAPLPEL